MDIASNVKDRIFATADLLYRQGGSQSFPTVDAVRKQAKVNMNDAATGMREWRRSQTVQVAQTDSLLPGSLRDSCVKALEGIWSEATAIANESLRAAQAGWEAERVENDTLRDQIALAFEEQTAELERANASVAALQLELSQTQDQLANTTRELESEARQTDLAEQALRQGEGKITELQRLTSELSNELIYMRQHNATIEVRHKEEIEFQRNEISTEREMYRQEQLRLRNAVEQLQQQLQQTLQAQVLELSSALKQQASEDGVRPPKGRSSSAVASAKGNGQSRKRTP